MLPRILHRFYWAFGFGVGCYLVFFSTALVAFPEEYPDDDGWSLIERVDGTRRETTDLRKLSDSGSSSSELSEYELVDRPDLSAAWNVVTCDERRNSLNAYIEFAKLNRKNISNITIDEHGETFICGKVIAKTYGVKSFQDVTNKYLYSEENKAFVADYYKTLKLNFGKQIADKVFPEELQQEATEHGLSSMIVCNSLKLAHAEVLEEAKVQLILKLNQLTNNPNINNQIDQINEQIDAMHRQLDKDDQVVLRDAKRFPALERQLIDLNQQLSQLEQKCSGSHQQVAELNVRDLEQILSLIAPLSGMLRTSPEEPLVNWDQADYKNQSYCDWITTRGLEITDIGMTINSCLIWARRAMYVAGLMGLVL